MCHHSVTIVIELSGAAGWTERQELVPFGRVIRLVESQAGWAQTFTLVCEGRSDYTLSAGETDELVRLLGRMVVKAPWEGLMGFDGCTYTLILRGLASGATFSWWADVPEGWESIGDVADYVMHQADRPGLSGHS